LVHFGGEKRVERRVGRRKPVEGVQGEGVRRVCLHERWWVVVVWHIFFWVG
jgi:hypothetical protein